MSAHTPGPWSAIDRLDGRLQFNIRDADGLTVCGVDHREGVYSGYGASKDANSRRPVGQAEAWANARLIAAAPELLESCLDLLVCMDLAKWGGDHVAIKARAAIAKAIGSEA